MEEEEFLEIEFSGKEIEDIIEKWGKLGFAPHMINNRNVSIAYELGGTWLEKNPGKYGGMSVVIFPIIYRVLKPMKEDLSIEMLKVFILELFDAFPLDEYLNIPNMKNPHNLDLECMFIASFSDNYSMVN